MTVKDVEVFKTGALKALIYACHYIFARTSIAIGAVPHEVTGFGSDDDFIAMILKTLAQHPSEISLGASGRRSVIISDIEVGYALVKCVEYNVTSRGIIVDISEIMPQAE